MSLDLMSVSKKFQKLSKTFLKNIKNQNSIMTLSDFYFQLNRVRAITGFITLKIYIMNFNK